MNPLDSATLTYFELRAVSGVYGGTFLKIREDIAEDPVTASNCSVLMSWEHCQTLPH